MSPTPKRYRFDTPMPSYESRPLPVRRQAEGSSLVSTPGGDQQVWQVEQPAPQIVHVHQAPPDRTVQRLALGAGIGAGSVAAAVYFGPLLVASLETIAVIVLAGALAIAVLAWAVVHVVGGVHGAQAGGRRKRRR